MRQHLCAVLVIVCTILHYSEQHLLTASGDPEYFQELPAKRFYAWEDGKRTDPMTEYKQIADKRKQFYAWAGKRSGNNVATMDKRKQFYAWAGRK